MRESEDVRRVLVLYTGGTIGMKQALDDQDRYELDLTPFKEQIRKHPLLHDSSINMTSNKKNPASIDKFVLPPFKEDPRIVYEVQSCGDIKQSGDATIQDWVNIAEGIKSHYHDYTGFVVLHGTDSMAYTASALSFMLESLNKTVVVTGAHTPMYELLNDAVDNLLGSLLIAGRSPVIPEVTIYFGHKLLRGNRSTKLNSQNFNCFASPAFPPLASVHADIQLQDDLILPVPLPGAFHVFCSMNTNLTVLHIFPGIPVSMVQRCMEPPTQGVVLQTYGTGAIPYRLQDELRKAAGRGVIIVVCTQCLDGPGAIDANFIQKTTQDVGLVSGADMTTEAALAKLSYVLGKHDLDLEQKKQLMAACLRGEMTPLASNQQSSATAFSYPELPGSSPRGGGSGDSH